MHKCINNCAPRYLADSFIHSFILNIYIAPLRGNYSEALPTPARLKRASGRYRPTTTDLGCGHQNPLTLPSPELRLKWVIGPSGSLAHAPGTIFLDLFRHTKTLPAFKRQLKLQLLHPPSA